MPKNVQTTSQFYSSHASKVMPQILQARLQQYINCELPDVQAGFRKGRGTRDQVANTHWIIEKAREFQKNIYFCFIDYAKAFESVALNMPENLENSAVATGLEEISFHSNHKRKAMPKNVQTTAQLHSSHTLAI